MKALAVFVHFSRDGKVCPNAMLYAKELTKYFDEVVISSNIMIVTNDPQIIALCFARNGYDFGYFHQAIEMLNAYDNYDVIGLFNDSNYIINSLEKPINWCMSNSFDLCGITDSLGGRPEIKNQNQHHIQSHFLIFKKKAILVLRDFMQRYKLEDLAYNVQDVLVKRLNIIIHYEIMLSVYMREHKMQIGAFYAANEFIKKNSKFSPQINMHMFLWKELIDNDYPLIKRKLVNKKFTKSDYDELVNTKGMTSMDRSKEIIKKKGNTYYTNSICDI